MDTTKLWRNEKGASIVEFAIVLPLFLVLIFGIIEFGIIMYNKAMITNASREGARHGIMYTKDPLSDAELETEVEERVTDKLGTSLISLGGPATFTIDVDKKTEDGVKYLEVAVGYPYNFLLLPELKFGGNLSNPFPIQSSTTMRMENQEDP